MKIEELRTLDAEELDGKLKDARRELYELRFKLAVGQLDNHRQIRQVRKDIAQILTIVHRRRWEGWEDESVTLVASSGETADPDTADPEAVAPEAVDSPEAVEDLGASPAAPAEPEAQSGAARKSRARKADREENE
jgi:large subunit ribosomal protein L29